MSMEKNRNSNFSMCQKIRSAMATSRPFRAIFGSSSYHNKQASTPNSNPPPASQTKPIFAQNPKIDSTEGAGAANIPIEFDFFNGAPKFEPEPPYVSREGISAVTKVPLLDTQNGKNFDIEFTKFLQKNKHRIERGGQPEAVAEEGSGGKKKDDHKDHHHHSITDFIDRAKKKIRTTSNVGKDNSFKIG